MICDKCDSYCPNYNFYPIRDKGILCKRCFESGV